MKQETGRLVAAGLFQLWIEEPKHQRKGGGFKNPALQRIYDDACWAARAGSSGAPPASTTAE